MVLPLTGSTQGVSGVPAYLSIFRGYTALLQKSRQNVGKKCHNSEMEKETEKKNLFGDQLIKETLPLEALGFADGREMAAQQVKPPRCGVTITCSWVS